MARALTQPSPISAAVAGDPGAAEAVARAWWPRMRRWALAELADVGLAEDASQDALIRLLERIGSYDPSRPFAPWLRALVRNCCRDVRRRRGTVLPFRADPGASSWVERDLDLHRASERAIRALSCLTPRQRQLIELCDRGHATPSEAAAELGIAPSTARALLHQGRSALRRALLADHADWSSLFEESP